MKVLHVITGLGSGGAERMMLNVISSLPEHEHHVLSLTSNTFLMNQLLLQGCEVEVAGSRNPFQIILAIRRKFASEDFDVLQSWMFHADLLSCLALGSRARRFVIWGVQAGELPAQQFSFVIRFIRKTLALLSSFMCLKVIVCSKNAAQVLVRVGYQKKKIVMIPNSVDTDFFSPNLMSTPEHDLRICIVPARWHPMKDHASLLKAWRLALDSGLNARLWLVGNEMDTGNLELKELIERAGVGETVELLGERSDMVSLYQQADFVCLSSQSGEGLPLALCEAMSTGLPAVVTNVGDMATVVGDGGLVVEAQNPEDLSRAFIKLGSLDRTSFDVLGQVARQRITADYSIRTASNRYVAVWKSTAQFK